MFQRTKTKRLLKSGVSLLLAFTMLLSGSPLIPIIDYFKERNIVDALYWAMKDPNVVDKGMALTKKPWVSEAKAAYTGKHIRTVEYVLGGNASGTAATDNSARASNTLAYAGTSWNTTKGSAGTKSIVLQGSGIRVRHAHLDVWFHSATAVDTTDVDLIMDVANGPNPGTDVEIPAYSAVIIRDNGGLSDTVRVRGDATALFDRQTDGQFNAGVAVVAGVRHIGETRRLTSAKLIITYEQDYSTSAHTETKTVRFPLKSTGSGDTGTMQAQCGASATCDFTYYADMPDLASNSDITDVFIEFSAGVNSTTASTFTPVTRNNTTSGTSGPAYAWGDTLAGDTYINVLWRPTVGGNNFNPNTASQSIRITNGSVPLSLLGGELVVTYNFSTGASEQTETVSYFLLQQTSATGTSKTTNSAVSTAISNSGFSVKNIWYKAHAAASESNTWTLYGTVGGAAERSQAYTLGGSNTIRAGDIATVYFDLTQDVGSYTSSPTNLDIETEWASDTGDAPVSAEAFITFTWSGSSGGTVTKSVKFGATPDGAETVASEDMIVPVYVALPEAVTKTYRSVYTEANISHSEGTNLGAIGTYTTRVNGVAQTITGATEEGTTVVAEPYLLTYYQNVTSTNFSGGSTIGWTERTFVLSATHNQADEKYATFALNVTYDAALGEDDGAAPSKHLRTVEYVLGSDASGTAASDNTTRTTGTLAYAGTSWNTTKGSAGTKSIVIQGSGIEVRHAHLEVWFHSTTSANTTRVDLFMDVANGPNPGTDVAVDQASAVILNSTSGLSKTFKTRADVTALFDRQTDGQFNAGVAVVAGVRHTGESRRLTSAKLVITYEQDYSTTAHTETKTVRFPLKSTGSGDTGTMQAQCGASATCDFTYYADMPDLASNSDIRDVFFEIHAGVNSTTASTLTPVTRNNTTSGTSGPAYGWIDTLAGDQYINVLWRPSVGGNNFNPNTASQSIRITNGTVPLSLLGGELVVTYDFSTGAATQTETVSYFLLQQTSATGTSKTTNSAVSTAISNSGFSVKNIWYKAHAAASESNTWTLYGTVGSASERSQAYTLGGSDTVRAGDIATVYFDLTQDVGSYTSSPTDLDIETEWSSATGDAPVSAEAFITFTWSGSSGGTVTKSVKFGASPSGAETVASEILSAPIYLSLPETVTKTHRSTYVEINHARSDATNITTGTYTSFFNGSTQTITEAGEEGTTTVAETYLLTYYRNASSTNFSGGSTIGWTTRTFILGATSDQADEKYASFLFNVTYDAELASAGAGSPTFTLSTYRFYVDNDGTNPTDPWGDPNLAENTIITTIPAANDPPRATDELRLRVAITIGNANLAATSRQFKLQYKAGTDATCTTGSWTDVGAGGGGSIWRFATSSVTDGATITAVLSVSDVNGHYVKANPSVTNTNGADVGQDIEYDFHIEHNGAADATTYSFRVVESDDAVFTAYTNCPTLETRPGNGNLLRHGNHFVDQSEKGFIWAD